MSVVLDTPSQIDWYRHVATLRGLEMECGFAVKYRTPPAALPTRGRAFGSAKRILAAAGKPVGRTRKQVLKQLVEYYIEIGLMVVAIDE
jgi:hypothetical protein